MQSQVTDQALSALAQDVGQALSEAGLKLVTAESCTGGWISKLLTEVAGSSAWFDRGFVTYSNQAKQDMLAVPEQSLFQHGAVSEVVVEAMTAGALNAGQADWALSVSGVAGPDGGTAEKPVGTVCFAWHEKGQPAQSVRELLQGDRDGIRRAACEVALKGLLEKL